MQTEIIVALVGIVGIIIGAIVNQLFARRKIDAEIEKIRAETDKARAESEKLRVEIVQLTAPTINESKSKRPEKITTTNILESLDNNGSKEYQDNPSPEEIMLAVDNLPEYQKDYMLNNYVGIKIRWRLALFSVDVKDAIVRLSLHRIEAGNLIIVCEVNVDDYPKIKFLKRHHKIWVSGRIDEISLGMQAFILSDCFLEID